MSGATEDASHTDGRADRDHTTRRETDSCRVTGVTGRDVLAEWDDRAIRGARSHSDGNASDECRRESHGPQHRSRFL